MAVRALTITHSTRVTDAVVATVAGMKHQDFNPWDRYEVDAGYCLDAVQVMPAGSHTSWSPTATFSSTCERR